MVRKEVLCWEINNRLIQMVLDDGCWVLGGRCWVGGSVDRDVAQALELPPVKVSSVPLI